MNIECNKIREILQSMYDKNLEIPGDIQNHLKTCIGCKEYWVTLSSLGKSLVKEIDKNLETMAPPDFKKIYSKKKRRNYSLPVTWGIAAVFVLSLGIFINSVLSTQQKNAEYISSDVQSFVSGIFSRPILYDDLPSYINGNDISTWFETDLFSEDTSGKSYIEIHVGFFN